MSGLIADNTEVTAKGTKNYRQDFADGAFSLAVLRQITDVLSIMKNFYISKSSLMASPKVPPEIILDWFLSFIVIWYLPLKCFSISLIF